MTDLSDYKEVKLLWQALVSVVSKVKTAFGKKGKTLLTEAKLWKKVKAV